MESRKVSWPGWETTRLIGRGSFGAVYEIQREIRGRTEHAALKVISIPHNESEIQELRADGYDDESITQYFADSLEKIEEEYAMMADLKGHSNVVYCDDICTVQHDDGFGWDIYIKMELLTPLKSYLSDDISDAQVIKLGMDICDALKLCEELNIVHRDIKPENIFVSRNGNYKLGDFGIAKTMEGTTGGTKTGTYDYMSPEVYNNLPYHTQTDIYSLGLVMYWLLNNRTVPFLPAKGKKPTPSEKSIARDRRFSGEKIPAPLYGSEQLQKIVLKACAFDPKDRYQSAREMREDLQRLFGGISNTDEPQFPQEPRVTKIPELSDDETVGPVFNREVKTAVGEENKTVGPTFGKNKVESADVEDKTVGPQFAPKQMTAPKSVKKKKTGIFIVAAVLVAVCVLCGTLSLGKKTDTETNLAIDSQQHAEEEFRIFEEQLLFNRVGDKITLTINRDNVTWTTTDSMVASVNDVGEITIIGPGNAEICADWNGQTRICSVTVNAHYRTESDYESAINQLETIEKYSEQYPTYTYEQIDALYNAYVESGGMIEPYSYPGTVIQEEPHAIFRCYLADWYYVLKVEYYDYLGELIYEDAYNVITDDNQIDNSKPPYSAWSMDDQSLFYTIYSPIGTFHRYKNPDPDITVKSMYEANYIVDGVTRCITVWTDTTQMYIVKVVAGEVHNVALYSDGSVKSSGLDYHGEGVVEGWHGITDICATEQLTVGLRHDGTVVATGRNDEGQCNVSEWNDISAIAASGYNVIGVKRDGTVVAVGNNDYGQCNVDSWTGILQADIGTTHSVGLRADGTVIATGDNEYGQCNVSDWTGIVSVKVAYLRTIGLKADGTVVATGGNFDGECDVSGWTDIVAIDTDGNHTVGLKSDGTVVAAGFNSWESYDACNVSNWTDIVFVEVGFYRTIGLKSDGTIVVTGWNDRGQCDISGLSLQ